MVPECLCTIIVSKECIKNDRSDEDILRNVEQCGQDFLTSKAHKFKLFQVTFLCTDNFVLLVSSFFWGVLFILACCFLKQGILSTWPGNLMASTG